MILVRATADSEAGRFPPGCEQVFAAMADYHQQLAQAGVLLDGSGLQPTRRGWRVRYGEDGQRSVVDGPFAEAKELIAGYTLIQVASREEALEWSRRFPNPVGEGRPAEIEVRQLYELDDFAPALPQDTLQRFRDLEQQCGGSAGTGTGTSA